MGAARGLLAVLGHVGGVKVTQRHTGNKNGGGPRPRGNGGEVGKSVSYISFIGGLFGFEQIKRNQGSRASVHEFDGQFQATRSAKLTIPTQHEEHSSAFFSLGHKLSLVAQFVRRETSRELSPRPEVLGSRAGCAVPKICKTGKNKS